MPTQKQLIVKSHIAEVKHICETRGIDYEITSPSHIQPKKKPKITAQELKEAYQKLAQSKNYEKEMQLWDSLEEDE